MKLEEVYQEIEAFSKETHGSTDYDKDVYFVKGENETEFAPFDFLQKKVSSVTSMDSLLGAGFVCDSYDLFGETHFMKWFEKQFSRKLTRAASKKIRIVHEPDSRVIFDAVESVNTVYNILREQKILGNGKNLPVQLGEWYAKIIFGLSCIKSTSQRGFDFYRNGKRVEVKVHWSDHSSPKGVKVRKSLVDLSDYTILMYIARNFMVREICFLDSNFVIRKFSNKGHTLFLKDSDVQNYFFSKSDKHMDKVVNKSALMKYASPVLAMKLAESSN